MKTRSSTKFSKTIEHRLSSKNSNLREKINFSDQHMNMNFIMVYIKNKRLHIRNLPEAINCASY